MVQYARSNGLPASIDTPVLLVGHIEDLHGIDVAGESMATGTAMEIGAAVTISELGDHPSCPAGLRQIIGEFASPAIRNRGTVGGNVCNASPAGDLLPYLYAADATVGLRSIRGEREIAISEFITGPGRTVLANDELLESVRIPGSVEPPGESDSFGHFYRKVAPRRSNALSKLSVYAEWIVGSSVVKNVRLAVGAVAPIVVRSPEVEARIAGSTTSDLRESGAEIAKEYAPLIVPIDDQRSTATYRKNTALALVRHLFGHVIPDEMETP